MLTRLFQNPLTRKRLRRFRAKRRAYWSFWMLLAAYVLSLGSELICNDRPLVVRFNGRWLFPVFRYYPESTFTGSARETRPDYRALAASPAFRSTPDNFMLFPLVPFSPYESVDPDSLRTDAATRLTFTPVPRVGNINVDADLTVARALACGYFFGTSDDAVEGRQLDKHWPVTEPLREAIAQRLRNAQAPAWAGTLTQTAPPHLTASVSLPAYTPREIPPTTVRLTFRQAEAQRPASVLNINADGHPVGVPPRLWDALPAEPRDTLLASARLALTQYVAPSTLDVAGQRYNVDAHKIDITWPYPPVRGHWMGIDNAGRDVLARILYGFRISMSFGFLLVAATMLLGIVIGGVQGYFGGKLDLTAQRFIEIWSALPFLYVMILLGAVYGRSFILLLVCYGLFNWIGISYYVRAEFLRLRRMPYVEAARCLGVPAWRIMLQHIFPNAITPVLTFFPFSLVGAIMALYGLDYLGFGLPPPTPSWGELLFQAQQYRWAWWLIFYPAAAIFIVMLLGVFIGEGLRDAFDPKPFVRME